MTDLEETRVARVATYKQTESRPRPKRVVPKTGKQREYWDAIPLNDITFGIGPAGTGKTFLAVAQAVASLQRGEVSKMILTRPAVEAGEHFGYLPGTLGEKMDPYMRPLIEAIKEIATMAKYQEWIALEMIEVAPLAYMRGRTLTNAVAILDEAQNSTVEQMRMFITRFGYGSKFIINGDPDQSDLLPYDTENGLDYVLEAMNVSKGVDGVALVEFGLDDIVRHPIVGRMLGAFNGLEMSRPI